MDPPRLVVNEGKIKIIDNKFKVEDYSLSAFMMQSDILAHLRAGK